MSDGVITHLNPRVPIFGCSNGLFERESNKAREQEGTERIDMEGDQLLGGGGGHEACGRGGGVHEGVIWVGGVNGKTKEETECEKGIDVHDSV